VGAIATELTARSAGTLVTVQPAARVLLVVNGPSQTVVDGTVPSPARMYMMSP
jgi:hypothetical protein